MQNQRVLFNIDFGLNEEEKQIFKKDITEILKNQNLIYDHLIILKSSEESTI